MAVDNQTLADVSIGATCRFFWDTQFEASLLSMLDPQAVKADILEASRCLQCRIPLLERSAQLPARAGD